MNRGKKWFLLQKEEKILLSRWPMSVSKSAEILLFNDQLTVSGVETRESISIKMKAVAGVEMGWLIVQIKTREIWWTWRCYRLPDIRN